MKCQVCGEEYPSQFWFRTNLFEMIAKKNNIQKKSAKMNRQQDSLTSRKSLPNIGREV